MGRRRFASALGWTTLTLLVGLGLVPLGDILLQPIERRYPAAPELERVDGIIVLGGGEDARASAFWNQVQLNQGAERYTASLALAQRFPKAKVLFTGGGGAIRAAAGIETSEASVAERFFHEQGIAPGRLLLERESRNTFENARLSRSLASPAPDERWVLVTSAFHMPRAMRSFEAAGWAGLVAWPVDYRTSRLGDRLGWNLTRNLSVLSTAIRERVGQLAYRLTGR
jgi:uncharacterized SAM-binding protein YcdF (DUF218 family)